MRRRLLSEGKATTRRYFEVEELLTEDIIINGGYISNTNGSAVPYDSWRYTEFIKIDSVDIILISKCVSSSGYNAFYDVDYKYIKNFAVNIADVRSIVLHIPENAKYIRMSWKYNDALKFIKRITLTE